LTITKETLIVRYFVISHRCDSTENCALFHQNYKFVLKYSSKCTKMEPKFVESTMIC